MVTYIWRDTASDLGGGADFSFKLLTGTATLGIILYSIAANSTESSYVFTEPGVPGSNFWGTAGATVEINTGSPGFIGAFLSVRLVRVTSTGTFVEAGPATAEQAGVASSILNFSPTAPVAGWTPGLTSDRLRIDLIHRNPTGVAVSGRLQFNTTNEETVSSIVENRLVMLPAILAEQETFGTPTRRIAATIPAILAEQETFGTPTRRIAESPVILSELVTLGAPGRRIALSPAILSELATLGHPSGAIAANPTILAALAQLPTPTRRIAFSTAVLSELATLSAPTRAIAVSPAQLLERATLAAVSTAIAMNPAQLLERVTFGAPSPTIALTPASLSELATLGAPSERISIALAHIAAQATLGHPSPAIAPHAGALAATATFGAPAARIAYAAAHLSALAQLYALDTGNMVVDSFQMRATFGAPSRAVAVATAALAAQATLGHPSTRISVPLGVLSALAGFGHPTARVAAALGLLSAAATFGPSSPMVAVHPAALAALLDLGDVTTDDGIADDVAIAVGALTVLASLGAPTFQVGKRYRFQKQRIHDRLVALAKAGPFFGVGYDKVTDLMQIEGDGDPEHAVLPQSIKTDEFVASGSRARLNRQANVWERRSWTWYLYLDFQEEVAAEVFEEALLAKPPVLPADHDAGLQQVTLTLRSMSYEHPPEHEATTGSRIRFTFEAELGPS